MKLVALAIGMAMPSVVGFQPGPATVVQCAHSIVEARPYTFWHAQAAVSFKERGKKLPYAILWNDGTLFFDRNTDGKIDGVLPGQWEYDTCTDAPGEGGAI